MNLVDRAWRLYCEETAGSMDVRDFWEELSPRVQALFISKVLSEEESQ